MSPQTSMLQVDLFDGSDVVHTVELGPYEIKRACEVAIVVNHFFERLSSHKRVLHDLMYPPIPADLEQHVAGQEALFAKEQMMCFQAMCAIGMSIEEITTVFSSSGVFFDVWVASTEKHFVENRVWEAS